MTIFLLNEEQISNGGAILPLCFDTCSKKVTDGKWDLRPAGNNVMPSRW